MFNAKNSGSSRSVIPESGAVNIIGAGTSIEGDIVSGGDIRIDGTLKGTIQTRGKLVVGPSGAIDGEVICRDADVSGTVTGKLTVTDLLALKATSKVTGDIITGKLAIEPGADFSGSCGMGGVVKEMQHDDSQKSLAEKTA